MEYTFTIGSAELTLDERELGTLLLRLDELEAWARTTANAIRGARYEPPVPSGPEELIALGAAIGLEDQRRGPNDLLQRDEGLARLRFYLDAIDSLNSPARRP